jgi:hypothetical protein
MKRHLTMIFCELLTTSGALALEKRRWLTTIGCLCWAVIGVLAQDGPAPKPADNGPSLEVTMKFIQEKLKDKSHKNFEREDIVADPVSCHLTITDSGTAKGDTTIIRSFSFREVEKIQVSPTLDDDGQATGAFGLGISMDSQTGVHHTYIYDKKHKKESFSEGYRFQFSDEDVANRVAKAMIHAVELCGGGSKPEPF